MIVDPINDQTSVSDVLAQTAQHPSLVGAGSFALAPGPQQVPFRESRLVRDDPVFANGAILHVVGASSGGSLQDASSGSSARSLKERVQSQGRRGKEGREEEEGGGAGEGGAAAVRRKQPVSPPTGSNHVDSEMAPTNALRSGFDNVQSEHESDNVRAADPQRVMQLAGNPFEETQLDVELRRRDDSSQVRCERFMTMPIYGAVFLACSGMTKCQCNAIVAAYESI